MAEEAAAERAAAERAAASAAEVPAEAVRVAVGPGVEDMAEAGTAAVTAVDQAAETAVAETEAARVVGTVS